MERQRNSLRMQRQELKLRKQILREREQQEEKLSFFQLLKHEWNCFWNFVDGSLKMKIILVLCALLLIGTVTKTISERLLYSQKDIVYAFAAS